MSTTPASTSGFDRYQAFYTRPPAVVVEWHDDRSPARGWLAIDRLGMSGGGGAAGGGTRINPRGTRSEAVFLAKTMGVKFRVAGPDIGGGKSVINFAGVNDPDAKRGVLERWYRHVGPYLKACYGTGGDVNVDEVEATHLIERVCGLFHPQEGIVRGHAWPSTDTEMPAQKLVRLREGMETIVDLADLPVPEHWMVGLGRKRHWYAADASTGYGVARSIRTYYRLRNRDLRGQRAVLEGFGAVGAFAAYYLAKEGVKIVAASTRRSGEPFRVAHDDDGIDVVAFINHLYDKAIPAPAMLPPALARRVTESPDGADLLAHKADIFIPAAVSHTLTLERIDALAGAGVKLVSCGANNPFKADLSRENLADLVSEMLDVQRPADEKIAIIPDFIANCGTARAFAYLMSAGAKLNAQAILDDLGECIDTHLTALLDGHKADYGLLGRAYSRYIPG
jgi:glutamate dehydrogenase/leucine dehydrogenase